MRGNGKKEFVQGVKIIAAVRGNLIGLFRGIGVAGVYHRSSCLLVGKIMNNPFSAKAEPYGFAL